jgi:hypothetical protein
MKRRKKKCPQKCHKITTPYCFNKDYKDCSMYKDVGDKKLKEYAISVLVYAYNDEEALRTMEKGEWECPEIMRSLEADL